jgi:hypothetical protein
VAAVATSNVSDASKTLRIDTVALLARMHGRLEA